MRISNNREIEKHHNGKANGGGDRAKGKHDRLHIAHYVDEAFAAAGIPIAELNGLALIF